MATIIYIPADAQVAQAMQADTGVAAAEAAIIVLSPQAVNDPTIEAAIVNALEHNQRIIPVLAKTTPLPRLIEHLEPLDFTEGYQPARLTERLNAMLPGELHLKVRTPQTIAANRRTGIIVSVVSLVVFVIALYAVSVLGIMAPAEEYDAIETEVIETQQAIMEEALPHSTEDALNFPATLEAAAPTARPFIAATATARAAGG